MQVPTEYIEVEVPMSYFKKGLKEVFNLYGILGNSYEDIENDVKHLNEPNLILLKYSINDVEDVLRELLESENYHGDWLSLKIINRVLNV